MAQQIHPFQVIGTKFLVDTKRALLADEMGMFKTSQAIFAKAVIERRVKRRRIKTLVACPNSVKAHWIREIQKWYYRKPPNIYVVESEDQIDVERAKKADFVLVNYDILSRRTSRKARDRLKALGKVGFEQVVLDEVQNAKNPLALRSRTVTEIADRAEYVALLSGTPVPNSVVDLCMLLHYLDPKTYPINFDPHETRKLLATFYALYKKDPSIVKKILEKRMLRRRVEDYLEKEVPRVVENTHVIPLTGLHKQVYEELLDNDDMPPETKLIQLEKAALDPVLVNPKYLSPETAAQLARAESCKYQALDRIIEEETRRGGKVLVFTSRFKVGVTEKLAQRYAPHGALVIDGDVEAGIRDGEDSEREKRRKLFQRHPEHKVLIAMLGTMNEGVDLTGATTVVFLDKPYYPAAVDQGIKRSQRVGEIRKKEVRILHLKATGETPTIDEGKDILLARKKRVMDYLLEGLHIRREELEEVGDGHIHTKRPISAVIVSPRKVIFEHFLRFRNAGAEAIRRFITRFPEIAAKIPFLYLHDWENTLPGKTAAVVKGVVDGLQELTPGKRKLDIACGPATLARTLGTSADIIGIDIDPHMLAAGKALIPEARVGVGNATQLPLKGNSFGLGVCSLAYQMLKPDAREQFFREANRVLEIGAHLIVTVPDTSINPENLENYRRGLQTLGFSLVEELSGWLSEQGSKYSGAVLTVRKTEDVSADKELKEKYFALQQDLYARVKKTSEKPFKGARPGEFFIRNAQGTVALGQALRNYVGRVKKV